MPASVEPLSDYNAVIKCSPPNPVGNSTRNDGNAVRDVGVEATLFYNDVPLTATDRHTFQHTFLAGGVIQSKASGAAPFPSQFGDVGTPSAGGVYSQGFSFTTQSTAGTVGDFSFFLGLGSFEGTGALNAQVTIRKGLVIGEGEFVAVSELRDLAPPGGGWVFNQWEGVAAPGVASVFMRKSRRQDRRAVPLYALDFVPSPPPRRMNRPADPPWNDLLGKMTRSRIPFEALPSATHRNPARRPMPAPQMPPSSALRGSMRRTRVVVDPVLPQFGEIAPITFMRKSRRQGRRPLPFPLIRHFEVTLYRDQSKSYTGEFTLYRDQVRFWYGAFSILRQQAVSAGFEIWIQDMSDRSVAFEGFIADDETTLDIPVLADGTYEFEARASGFFWEGTRDVKRLRIEIVGGEILATTLPSVTALASRFGNGGTNIRWTLTSNYSANIVDNFGVWFGPTLPLSTVGAPDAIVNANGAGVYQHMHAQSAEEFVGVSCRDAIGTIGPLMNLRLPWSTETLTSPENQFANDGV